MSHFDISEEEQMKWAVAASLGLPVPNSAIDHTANNSVVEEGDDDEEFRRILALSMEENYAPSAINYQPPSISNTRNNPPTPQLGHDTDRALRRARFDDLVSASTQYSIDSVRQQPSHRLPSTANTPTAISMRETPQSSPNRTFIPQIHQTPVTSSSSSSSSPSLTTDSTPASNQGVRASWSFGGTVSASKSQKRPNLTVSMPYYNTSTSTKFSKDHVSDDCADEMDKLVHIRATPTRQLTQSTNTTKFQPFSRFQYTPSRTTTRTSTTTAPPCAIKRKHPNSPSSFPTMDDYHLYLDYMEHLGYKSDNGDKADSISAHVAKKAQTDQHHPHSTPFPTKSPQPSPFSQTMSPHTLVSLQPTQNITNTHVTHGFDSDLRITTRTTTTQIPPTSTTTQSQSTAKWSDEFDDELQNDLMREFGIPFDDENRNQNQNQNRNQTQNQDQNQVVNGNGNENGNANGNENLHELNPAIHYTGALTREEFSKNAHRFQFPFEPFECPVCMGDFETNLDIVNLTSPETFLRTCPGLTLERCGCTFCFDCLRGSLETQVNDNANPLRCPLLADCPTMQERVAKFRHEQEAKGQQQQHAKDDELRPLQSTLMPYEAALLLNSHVLNRHSDQYALHPIRDAPHMFQCSVGSCGYMEDMQDYDGEPAFNCRSCHTAHCLKCKSPWHINETCEQYKQRLSADQHKLVIPKGDYKLCPRCQVLIHRTYGCDNMKCLGCNYGFCWKCGSENSTCNCTPASHVYYDNKTGAPTAHVTNLTGEMVDKTKLPRTNPPARGRKR